MLLHTDPTNPNLGNPIYLIPPLTYPPDPSSNPISDNTTPIPPIPPNPDGVDVIYTNPNPNPNPTNLNSNTNPNTESVSSLPRLISLSHPSIPIPDPQPSLIPCPPENIVNCFVDPCRYATCPGIQGAKCESNYCGGCNAIWKDPFTLKQLTQLECHPITPYPIESIQPTLPVTDPPILPKPCAMIYCFARPCSVTSCPAYPEATCVDDYCGGCNAIFTDINTGRELSDAECNDIAPIIGSPILIPSNPTLTSTSKPSVTPPNPDPEPIPCPADAKICPDGSFVVRDFNNNCEWQPCPIIGIPAPRPVPVECQLILCPVGNYCCDNGMGGATCCPNQQLPADPMPLPPPRPPIQVPLPDPVPVAVPELPTLPPECAVISCIVGSYCCPDGNGGAKCCSINGPNPNPDPNPVDLAPLPLPLPRGCEVIFCDGNSHCCDNGNGEAMCCPNQAILCTADVKNCADGSYVHRDPNNNCEFKICRNIIINNNNIDNIT